MFQGIVKLYRWPLLVLSGLFGLGILTGLVLPSSIKLSLIQVTAEKFSTIISSSPTTWQLGLNIFSNNIVAGCILAVFGFTIILAGIVIFGNGMIIGVFLSLLYRLDALLPGTFWGSMVALLPHGIFEIPAFLLSGAVSIVIVLKMIFNTTIEKTKTRWQVAYAGTAHFVMIIIPLFALAAAIEAFLSPQVNMNVTAWLAQQANDPKLAVTLNTTALAQAGCIPLSQSAARDNQLLQANNTTSLTQVTSVLNDHFYTQLKNRRHLPFWESHFLCRSHGIISVRAWPTDSWTTTQALDLAKKYYDINATPYNQGDMELTSTKDNTTIAQRWISLEDKTVEVTQYNYSMALKKVIQLPSLTTAE